MALYRYFTKAYPSYKTKLRGVNNYSLSLVSQFLPLFFFFLLPSFLKYSPKMPLKIHFKSAPKMVPSNLSEKAELSFAFKVRFNQRSLYHENSFKKHQNLNIQKENKPNGKRRKLERFRLQCRRSGWSHQNGTIGSFLNTAFDYWDCSHSFTWLTINYFYCRCYHH